MFALNYVKIFLDGPLAGMPLPCSFPVPNYDVAVDRLGQLLDKTEANPGRDCVTGLHFWCTNVEIVQVPK